MNDRSDRDAVNAAYDRPPAGSPPPPPQASRLPAYPEAAGTYWLKLVVDAEGVGTLTWEETITECPE